VTSNDVTDETIFEDLKNSIKCAEADIVTRNVDFLDSSDCQMGIKVNDRDPQGYYEIIDHTNRRVLEFTKGGETRIHCFPDKHASKSMLEPVKEKGEHCYWDRFSLNPAHHDLPDRAEKEMLAAVAYFTTGRSKLREQSWC
jgi:hypothetical protein